MQSHKVMIHSTRQGRDLTPPTDGGIALARRLSNRKVIDLQELQDRNLQGNESNQFLLGAVFKTGEGRAVASACQWHGQECSACQAEGRDHELLPASQLNRVESWNSLHFFSLQKVLMSGFFDRGPTVQSKYY
jgi:hypothetical protein